MDIRRALFKTVLLCVILDNHNTFVATLAPATTEQPITARLAPKEEQTINWFMYGVGGGLALLNVLAIAAACFLLRNRRSAIVEESTQESSEDTVPWKKKPGDTFANRPYMPSSLTWTKDLDQMQEGMEMERKVACHGESEDSMNLHDTSGCTKTSSKSYTGSSKSSDTTTRSSSPKMNTGSSSWYYANHR